MTVHTLPDGLIHKGGTPTFDENTLPDALCDEHSLKANRWGILHVLEGAVFFVDLVTHEERRVEAPAQVVILPEHPHKLRLDGPLRCRVDFFRPDKNM